MKVSAHVLEMSSFHLSTRPDWIYAIIDQAFPDNYHPTGFFFSSWAWQAMSTFFNSSE